MNYFKISKFFLVLSVLFIAIVTPSTLFPFIVGKYVWFRVGVLLSSIFFLLGTILNPHEFARLAVRERLKNPLVIAIAFFVGAFLLACLFGVDPAMSFWSNFERGEGGFQMATLFLFFLLLAVLFREERDWRRIFGWSLLAATLMILYGVGAGLKYVDAEFTKQVNSSGGEEWTLSGTGGPFYQTFKNFIGPSFKDPGFRFGGSIGNPAYVATYLVFSFFYLAYLFATKYRHALLSAGAIGYYVLAAFFLVFFVLAATRGAFIGLAAAAFLFLCYIAYTHARFRRAFVVAAFSLVLVLVLLVVFKNSSFVSGLPGYPVFSRMLDISFTAKTFQDRTTIWKMAWDGFVARPIFGWGPENFIHVFDRHFNPAYFNPSAGFGAWFDRAHSIFLDYLVETGIVGLLGFLGIFAAYYFQFAKKWIFPHKKHRDSKTEMREQQSRSIVLEGLMLVLPVAYLVQGLVLFDVLPIYVNLYLFLAFAVYQFERSHQSL